MNALERSIIALTNSERTRRGLAACSMDEQLADVARMHSADMLKRNFPVQPSPPISECVVSQVCKMIERHVVQ